MRLYDITQLDMTDQEYGIWWGGFDAAGLVDNKIKSQPFVEIPEFLADIIRDRKYYDREEYDYNDRYDMGKPQSYPIEFPKRESISWGNITALDFLVTWVSRYDFEMITYPNWDINHPDANNNYAWFCAWKCMPGQMQKEFEMLKPVVKFIWDRIQLKLDENKNNLWSGGWIDTIWIE